MTRTTWIIGAVIVVGIGIAAGVIFAGGNKPQANAASPARETNTATAAMAVASPPLAAPVTAEAVRAPAPTAPPAAAQVEIPVQVASDTTTKSGPIVIDTLDELFAHAATYSNKAVVVRGHIVTQCISGCTFSLEDGTAVIAVELIDDALDHVLDGGSIGRSVEVRGTVETSPQLVIVIEDPEDWNYID
ncbi:hypothetical protein KKG90_09515 [Candidatus Bipolaricaulota bacterium]|nr:hypothetical protein [Candidatus Bipolaricaulota bacterium]